MYKQLTLASGARVPRTESTDIHVYESEQSKLYGKWGGWVGVGVGEDEVDCFRKAELD